MPMDSRHVRPERCQCRSKNKCQQIIPIAMILDANCHVAALRLCQPLSKSPIAGYNAHLKASDTQYAMKLVTPHFRSCLGTGSMSLFVLENISMQPTDFHPKSPIQVLPNYLPSCVPLSKGRHRLLHLQRQIRSLNAKHRVDIAISGSRLIPDESRKGAFQRLSIGGRSHSQDWASHAAMIRGGLIR